jgi:hypothetical protein
MKNMKIMKENEFSHPHIMHEFSIVIFKPFMIFMVKINAMSGFSILRIVCS